MIRAAIRDALSRRPALDGRFRRHLWSRIHFPEAELRALDALPAGSIDGAIDVGAALGSYAWVLARKARRVVSYEPGEVHGRYMTAATAGTNVTLVRAAVGDEPGEVDMFTPGDDNDARHQATLSAVNPVVRTAGTTVHRVEVVTLDDDAVARLGPQTRIDVIKIDVEGFENAVLRGAAGIIARHHPLIIAEIEARHNPDYRAAFAQLRAAGYAVHFWRDGAYRPLVGDDIAAMQLPADLERRLAGGDHEKYINNFVFQHAAGRIKLVAGAA